MLKQILSLFFVLGLLSCATDPKLIPEVSPAHLQTDETPLTPEKAGLGDQETVVLMGINDFHGALAPLMLKTAETPGTPSVEYEAGGATILASYVRILKNQHGPNLVVLDAGDEFQGTIDSHLEKGAPVVRYLNEIGVNAAAVGNHEFTFGLDELKARADEASYPYLSANLKPEQPNILPHAVLQAGRLRIGVIGLTTTETNSTARPETIRGLAFSDLATAAAHSAKILRQKDVHLVVLLAHVGIFCGTSRASHTAAWRKASDPHTECIEDHRKSELLPVIQALPPGTIDAVVSGHSHSLVHHWANGVPVIQGGSHGRYFNLMYLTYDLKQKKLIADKTRIEGPVPVCPKVFEKQKDCRGDLLPPKGGRGKLVTPLFHGEKIGPDPRAAELLEPVFDKTEPMKQKVIGQAARPVTHTRSAESEFGNLVADAIRDATQADFALVNPGSIRESLDAGEITFEELYRAIPFDNSLAVIKVTAEELKTLLRVSQTGVRGLFPVSGLQLRVVDLSYPVQSDDLNRDGKHTLWEIDRLKEVRLTDGSKLKKKYYTIATVDYLVSGGDDMAWAMSRIPKERIQLGAGGLVRDAVIQYLGKSGAINTPDQPLIDPSNPRLKMEPPGQKKHKRRS